MKHSKTIYSTHVGGFCTDVYVYFYLFKIILSQYDYFQFDLYTSIPNIALFTGLQVMPILAIIDHQTACLMRPNGECMELHNNSAIHVSRKGLMMVIMV